MELFKKSTLVKQIQEEDKLNEYLSSLDSDVRDLFLLSQGRVRFGTASDGTRGENVKGQYQVIADTGAADTEFTVAHTLGAVPVGFLVVNINVGGVIYDSGTAWTSSNVYLKCSVANAAVTIFLMG